MVTETASTIDTVQFFNWFKVFCKHIICDFASKHEQSSKNELLSLVTHFSCEKKLIFKGIVKAFLVTKNGKVVTKAALNEVKKWSNLTLQKEKVASQQH